MFRKSIAFFLLCIGIILPWRLRCLYIELLGWITQFFYLSYITILKFIISELQKAQVETENHGLQ